MIDDFLCALSLSRLCPKDLELLMLICERATEERFNISFDEIGRLSSFHTTSKEDLVQKLDSTSVNLCQIVSWMENEKYSFHFPLFRGLAVANKELVLRVYIDPKFTFLHNVIASEFTLYRLSEFAQLNGKYQKHLYLLLMRHKTFGVFKINADDFRKKMGIPESYPARDVTEKILKPSVKVLKKMFFGLTFEVVRKNGARGNPVSSYIFKFLSECPS